VTRRRCPEQSRDGKQWTSVPNSDGSDAWLRANAAEAALSKDALTSRFWGTFPVTEQREYLASFDYLRFFPRKLATRQAVRAVTAKATGSLRPNDAGQR
jgi:hypothetical protein